MIEPPEQGGVGGDEGLSQLEFEIGTGARGRSGTGGVDVEMED